MEISNSVFSNQITSQRYKQTIPVISKLMQWKIFFSTSALPSFVIATKCIWEAGVRASVLWEENNIYLERNEWQISVCQAHRWHTQQGGSTESVTEVERLDRICLMRPEKCQTVWIYCSIVGVIAPAKNHIYNIYISCLLDEANALCRKKCSEYC